MGIPVIKPPPRREGESWEDYRVRCGPWRQATLGVIRESRVAFRQGIFFVAGVLAFCAIVLVVRGCAP